MVDVRVENESFYFLELAATCLGFASKVGSRVTDFGSSWLKIQFVPVLRIWIRIPGFLGLPDPDPLVRGMDPDPVPDPDSSIIKQKW